MALFCIALGINAQSDTLIKFDQNYYRVFISLNDARKVDPDSVQGLFLCCEKLTSFPNEVFKYPNLKFLYFANTSLDNPIAYKKASKRLKRKYHRSAKKRKPFHEIIMPEFPSNKFSKIPSEIVTFKNLKVLCLGDLAYNFKIEDLEKLEDLLPSVIIDPPLSIVNLNKGRVEKYHSKPFLITKKHYYFWTKKFPFVKRYSSFWCNLNVGRILK